MDDYLNSLTSDTLHHAYILLGQRDVVVPKIFTLLERLNLPTKGNQNFSHQEFDSFTIEDGRNLKMSQSIRASAGDKKIFIYSISAFTHDAPHSLLKVLEEPTEGTHFFFVLENEHSLLPTLASRALILKDTESTDNKQFKKLAKEFYGATPKERLDSVSKFIEENEDEDNKFILRSQTHVFLNELERFISTQYNKQDNKNSSHHLEEIFKARLYLSQSGSSVKMILEHLSLLI